MQRWGFCNNTVENNFYTKLMSNNNIPIVKPINVKEYEFKQSKYGVAPRLPASMIISAPSGSGKTILLQSLILDIYRNCFARIYIFSPSINVDSIWTPVKKYIRDEMKVDTEKEQCYKQKDVGRC